MKTTVSLIVGYVILKSSLTLEEVGKVLSDKIFGGLPFAGKDLHIHEEVPAIFIQSHILGLEIVLDGHSGFKEGCGYNLSIEPLMPITELTYKDVRIDKYLYYLLKNSLKDFQEIEVYENEFLNE